MPDATAIARALGVAPAVAARWMRQGMPVDSLDAARAWLAQGETEKSDDATLRFKHAIDQPSETTIADERRRLFREQADAIAMKNARARKELAPVWLLEMSIAKVGRQIAGIFRKRCRSSRGVARHI